MAIIKKTFKYGTALGITYLTVEQRLWSQLSHKEIDDKLSVVCDYEKRFLRTVAQKTGFSVDQWLPTAPAGFDAKNLWNGSIKTCFKTLSELDLKALIQKVQKLVNKSD